MPTSHFRDEKLAPVARESFGVRVETITYEGQQLQRWIVGDSTFLALPEKGARLLHWNLRHADGSVRDVVHWPEQADFADVTRAIVQAS